MSSLNFDLSTAHQPLGLKDINEMVANVLHYSDSDLTEALSNLVFTKTKGNPFFIISFLTKLYQSELIVRPRSSLARALHCKPES